MVGPSIEMAFAMGFVGLLVGVGLTVVVDQATLAYAGGERAWASADAAFLRRFLIQVATAGLFTAIVWRFGWSWELPAYLALAAFLVVLSTIDLDTKLLPRRIVYAAGAAGVVLLAPAALLAGQPGRTGWAAAGAVGTFAVLYLLHGAARGGLGFGDVRLGAVVGWYLGWLDLTLAPGAVVMAFVLSAIAGLAFPNTGRAGRQTSVPFGPFLATGALIAILA